MATPYLKRFFALLFFSLPITGIFGQQLQQHQVTQFTPGGFFDTVSDHLGHRYSLGEIAISDGLREEAGGPKKKTTAATCSSGYFQLFLEPGCGLDGTDAESVARLNVVCQMLNDISQFINSPLTTITTGQKVNLWVRNPTAVGWLPPGFAGVAGSFFNQPSSTTLSGIADNAVWQTINSGTDAYKGVVTPLYTSGGTYSYGATFFHGWMAFQCDGSVPWHTDLLSPTPAGKIDLYTVALHEMLHSLGFATLIEYNGTSRLGGMQRYYSRYDRYLQTTTGQPLITSSSPGCGMYNWSFNPSLTAAAVVSPGSTAATCPSGYQTGAYVNHTACSNAVNYADGTMTQPVYTPACYERGSSLSHFEDECTVPAGFAITPPTSNDHYFVMSNATRPGPYSATSNPGGMKRFPRPEERTVLCDIGYSVNTTYGSAANLNLSTYGGSVCPGLQVAGVCDGINTGGAFSFFTSGTTPVVINGLTAGSILANDYNATAFKCLEVISGGGSVSVSSGSATTVVSFTPAAGASGVQLLRYIPLSATGAEGNITYVYVFVGDPLCVPSACDLVLNGGFESINPASLPFVAGAIHCWVPMHGDPDLYSRGPTGYAIPGGMCSPPSDVHFPGTSTALPNDHYLVMLGIWNPFYIRYESIQSPLASTLISGNTYQVSCWAKIANATSVPYPYPTHIQMSVSPSLSPLAPSLAYGTAYPSGLTNLCIFPVTYSPSDHDWHYLSATVTYTGPDANTLVVFHAAYLNPTTGPYGTSLGTYIILDDVSIKPATGICSFLLDDTLCTGTGTIDLNTKVSIPGGTFSWLTDSAGYVVTTHDTLFNTPAAYSASCMTGDTGVVLITYKYTDINGCKQTAYDELHLVNDTITAITGNTNLCSDDTTLLSNATPGGHWVSGNTSVAVVTSASGIVGGVTPGTAMISYVLPNGCYASIMVIVHGLPVTGGSVVDVGSTITLGYPVSVGTWASGNTAVATIDAVTGVLTGMSPGTAMISYNITSECRVLHAVTVNPAVRVNVIAEPSFSLKPNPSKGTFTVSGMYDGDASLEVMNMTGQELLSTMLPVTNNSVNKQIFLDERFANGIYLLKIKTGQTTRMFRLVVER